MKTAMIFGVTGQDGYYLASLLLQKNYKVIGVTRRSSTDNTSRLKGLIGNPNFMLSQGDITDVSSVRNLLNSSVVNEVYNLAAQSHVGISFSQPLLTWDVTAKGCINILQSIVDLGLKDVRFYQASSSEMFGANYSIASDLNKYQDEKTPFLPQSPYAVAKVAAHNSVRLYRESYGVHGSCGILFNHESPVRGENFVTRKITKWIGEFRRWLDQTEFCFRGESDPHDKDYITCHGKPFRSNEFPRLRLGNLDAYRDWGFAGDYVEAMWLMLQQEKPDDYVICTEHTYSVRDFIQTAFHAANKVSGRELFTSNYMDYIIIDPAFYRPAEVDYLRGRCSKAKKVLGWSPRHSFEDLVNMMVSHDL